MRDKQPSPTPWAIHRTGSHIGIKDAKGKFVIRKIVNMLTLETYAQISTDFEHICAVVNAAPVTSLEGERSETR